MITAMIKCTGVEEIEDEETNTRWQTYRTLTDNRTGAPNNHQQKAVVDDQPVPAEKDVHNNNQMENDMINKEDEQTNFRVDFQYFYERRKGKLQTSSEVSSIFSQLTSRHKVMVHFKYSYQYLFDYVIIFGIFICMHSVFDFISSIMCA